MFKRLDDLAQTVLADAAQGLDKSGACGAPDEIGDGDFPLARAVQRDRPPPRATQDPKGTREVETK